MLPLANAICTQEVLRLTKGSMLARMTLSSPRFFFGGADFKSPIHTS